MTVTGGDALSPRLRAGRFAAQLAGVLASWIAVVARPRRPQDRWLHGSPLARPEVLSIGVAAVVTGALSMRWLDGHATATMAKLPVGMILFFDGITDFGRSGWLLVPLAAMIVAAAVAFMNPALDRIPRAVVAAVAVRLGFLFVAIGLPGLIGTIVKRCIGRVRPSEEGPFAYEPFSWHSAYASMPSGHTITAFSALVAVGLICPRLRPVLWVYALAIAASRIIVTAHYPSDVIAGAAFGSLGALLVRDWFAARRLGFHVAPDGRVRAQHGPSWARLRRLAAVLFRR